MLRGQSEQLRDERQDKRRNTLNSDSLQEQGLTRTAMALLFLTILIATSFWVLHLFLTPLLWATMIVVSTWPLLLRLQAVLWGRRSLAAAVMTLLLLMVLIVPFLLAVGTIVARSEEIIGWIKSFATFSLPPPPDWVRNLPSSAGSLSYNGSILWPSDRRSFRFADPLCGQGI